ncbi:hypothetical protein EZS27_000357 [termite gut metagenome]|jgi:hypothetical protein|uniref:Uncharacterized protein n=1 Tax=termite gut metagenome TaxID=433724 RepID=A0A5J4T256_9ZZZZ
MITKKERYFVYLACKPYVKQYLINNYGDGDSNNPDAVSFFCDKELQNRFRSMLRKPNDNLRCFSLVRSHAVVPIEIRKDDFYRRGFMLPDAESALFCSFIEAKIKLLMCTYIDTHVAIGLPIASVIRNFQRQYDFPEDSWSYDTIRREYNRKKHVKVKEDRNLADEFFQKINKILMLNLSEIGTITAKGFERYEKHLF